MLHKTSQERYNKLKRVFGRLMRNFNVDDLDDFIATANSMPVWMGDDPMLTQEQQDAVARQKHVKPQRPGGPALQVTSVKINPGGRGVLLQPMRVIGAGDEVTVDCSGTQESALAFVVRTFRHFHYMFELAPVPPAQRQIPTLSDLVGA